MAEMIPGLLSGYYNMDRHLAETENTEADTQYKLGQLAIQQQKMGAERAAAPWKLAQEQMKYASDEQALQKAYRDDDEAVMETTMREIAPLVKRYREGGQRLEFQASLAKTIENNRERYQLTDGEVAQLSSMSLEEWEDTISGVQSIEDQAKSTVAEQQANAYRGLAPNLGLSPDVAAGVDPATVNAWLTEQGRMKRHSTASASSLQTGSAGMPSAAAKKYDEMVAMRVPEDVAQGVAYGTIRQVSGPDGSIALVDVANGRVMGSMQATVERDPKTHKRIQKFQWVPAETTAEPAAQSGSAGLIQRPPADYPDAKWDQNRGVWVVVKDGRTFAVLP